MNTVDVSKLSTKQLKALLEERQKAENEERQAKRKEYEDERENLITELGANASAVAATLAHLKAQAFEQLASFREKMLEYGDLRRGDKNKGNFEVKNEHYKIEFKSQIRKAFDERAELAEEKLREFLNTYLKKKAHKDVVAIITSLLERNTKSGEYDINLINRLYAMKDRFNDRNWQEAIEMFQESYSPQGTTHYVRFYTKNTANGWDAITLDIASVKLPEVEEQAAE